MTIYLHQREQGKHGKIFLYLEYYKGTITDSKLSGVSSISPVTVCKDTNFYDYFSNHCESKKDMPVYVTYQQSVRVFKDFVGVDINFSSIDEKFCNKYLYYLQRKKNSRGGLLKKSLVNQYFQHFSSAVKQGLKEKIITNNPLVRIKSLKTQELNY